MASAAALYTPEVLALATSLARYPWDETLSLKGAARSRSCGSTISLCLETDQDGRIARLGLRSQACAVGQAAAAIFATAAAGKSLAEIREAEQAILHWLAGDSPLPDWPGLAAIEPARAYPGRHGAIMLAWQAARDLLPSD